jgi:regulator of sigma E protease
MLASILKFLLIAIEVLAIFNLLIFVHELGHFLAARWRGLYIEEFALWFGKPLWRKKFNGVWYAINSVPAGGYVKLPQLAGMESLEGTSELPPEAMKPIKPLDKIIVAFAGPLFSFLLAFAMAVAVWIVGKPESEFDSKIIGYLKPGGPGAVSGLQVGDEILEVDHKPVTHFLSGTNSVKWAIIRSEGATIPFKVKRGDQVLTIESGWTKPETSGWRRPSLREVQLGPRTTPGVGFVVRKSAADAAGFKSGDLVISVNGKTIFNLDEIDPFVRDNRGGTLAVVVSRDGHEVPLSLAIPAGKNSASDSTAVNLGIDWGRITLAHPDPWTQVREAATTIFRMVGALTSSKSDVKAAHFSGPVGIMRLYYQVFEGPEGWRLALALSVLINVNLAMINLLPLPILDGGHMLVACIEAVRRKPVNGRAFEMVTTACAVALIGFMLYVSYFDIGDLFGREKRTAEPPKVEEIGPAK